jgi:predicted GNAT superfamily acetyltransferase
VGAHAARGGSGTEQEDEASRRCGGDVLTRDGISYRPLEREAGDHAALAELQASIWGREMVTPHHQLIAADHVGGVLLGAFDRDRCVGFSYGFPAHGDGEVWLHSHQTGVRDGYRDRGIGRILKWLQRHHALAAGYPRVTWTFDPLQARNAHVNLERLGGTSAVYAADYYGPLTGELNEGIPSDRLWLDWDLRADRVTARFSRFLDEHRLEWPGTGGAGRDDADAYAGAAGDRTGGPADDITADLGVALRADDQARPTSPRTDLDVPAIGIATPTDIDALRRRDGDGAARRWRNAHREIFTTYLGRGYVIHGFARSEGTAGTYVLRRSERGRSGPA